MDAWIVLVVVIAGMVKLFVVIAIAVSHTGQTTVRRWAVSYSS